MPPAAGASSGSASVLFQACVHREIPDPIYVHTLVRSTSFSSLQLQRHMTRSSERMQAVHRATLHAQDRMYGFFSTSTHDLHRTKHRPSTPTRMESAIDSFIKPNIKIRLYNYTRLLANISREAISTCIIHMPCRCGKRCNSSSTSSARHGIDTSSPWGRLQATHHCRHAAATPSPTLHRQGHLQCGLHQHHRQQTTAASTTSSIRMDTRPPTVLLQDAHDTNDDIDCVWLLRLHRHTSMTFLKATANAHTVLAKPLCAQWAFSSLGKIGGLTYNRVL